MSLFSVFGATGFIGSHLTGYLHQRGHDVHTFDRTDAWRQGNLGCVVYCAGITWDFRRRLVETLQAHICGLLDLLDRGIFESLIYLSSTRVYALASSGSETSESFAVNPFNPDHIYALSKLAGEAACLSSGRPGVHVARLSNVYGPDWRSDNFLISLIRDAVDHRQIVLRSHRSSSKDYVSIDDVIRALVAMAERGTQPIYNVAAGRNRSHEEIVSVIQAASKCGVRMDEAAPPIVFPTIDVSRMKSDLGIEPADVLDDLPSLVRDYQSGERRP